MIKNRNNLDEYLRNFKLDLDENNTATVVDILTIKRHKIKRYTNEYWTSKQRQHSSIHEVSYRACFKPQLPRFFIDIFTNKGDVVYDPFGGRGTTAIEAALLGRNIASNDINPLSKVLTKPRLAIPELKQVKERLSKIQYDYSKKSSIDLTMFYHKKTLSEIVSLRDYLSDSKINKTEDYIDEWIRMVATNRLTGHSSGFFSVYTLPPNQAVSQKSQKRINEKRNQIPEYKDTKKSIIKKSKSLLRSLTENDVKNLNKIRDNALFTISDVRQTTEILSNSVKLLVTSPPFLDIVQYSNDNWLRCWFNNIDEQEISKKITGLKNVDDWSNFIEAAFKEFYRIIIKNGVVAFEVGDVRKGTIKLDEYVVPLGIAAGFKCEGILVNMQEFTKTSNIWGVGKNNSGTNTNRIVVFRK